MFEAGVSGNPRGRPKGSCGGRIRALAGLDRMLAKKKNQQALLAALEREFRDNPVRFFKTVVMPLLPREAKMSFDREGVIVWRSLLAAGGDDGIGLSACVPAQAGGDTAGKGLPALPE